MYLPRDDPIIIIIIIKPSKGSGGLRESNRKKREARWLLDPRAKKKTETAGPRAGHEGCQERGQRSRVTSAVMSPGK